MNMNPTNEFDNFIDTFVNELIATSDDEILQGLDPFAAHAEGLGLLQFAKTRASRSRLAAARVGYAALKLEPAIKLKNVSAAEARRFLAQAANDSRFTLAARNLGELSDDEAIALYAKLKSLQTSFEGDNQ